MKLRPYQQRAIERVRQAMQNGVDRVLLVAPTGAGKTVVASALMATATEKGKKVLFLAHRRELITQCYQKLLDFGLDRNLLGIIMGKDPRRNMNAAIQVASVDTLRNRDKPPANLVIVDECHRSVARTYLGILDAYPHSNVIGLTATPYRSDGRGLGDIYHALELVATPLELIAEGFLVCPRVFSVPPDSMPDLQSIKIERGDYVLDKLSEAMNQRALVGNIVKHWKELAQQAQTVVFAVSIEHSQHIASLFRDAGIAAEHLDGTTPSSERDAILARLGSGETRIVCNCGVLCEGWDMPSVKCAILARPTKSTGLYLQQAGRILRPYKGQEALILDHAGNALEHGLPQETRAFSLDVSRRSKEKREATARTCPSCFAVLPKDAYVCSACGASLIRESTPKKGLETKDGQLIEIEARDLVFLAEQWARICEDWRLHNDGAVRAGFKPYKPGWIWHRFTQLHGPPPAGFELPKEEAGDDVKASAFRELQKKAEQCGYKPGWAAYKFKLRFGHWPRKVA